MSSESLPKSNSNFFDSLSNGIPSSTSDEVASSESNGNGTEKGLPSVNLPRGGGAIRGIGEKFSVSPATGTASATIPLPVTSGRSGFAPALTLSYDSGYGNSPYGFGWSLSLPSVRRKSDRGLPNYCDEQISHLSEGESYGEVDVFQISEAEDLVPVLDHRKTEDRECKWIQQKPRRRRLNDKTYDVFLYRPRIESAFARIELWRDVHVKSRHWRSITRTNITTLYGEDENSRIYDPTDPSRVFQWLASRSYDDKGSSMVFEYKAENDESVNLLAPHEAYRPAQNRTVMKYLKRVKYGNRISQLLQKITPSTKWMFELVFDYGDHKQQWPMPQETCPWPTRSDPFSHYRAGFEIRTYRLCRRVLMFHHFPGEMNMGNDTLVSSLDMSHFENGHVHSSNLSSASCTSSFSKASYQRKDDGYLQSIMPPLEIEYSTSTISHETGYLHTSALEGLPVGINEPAYQFIDLDGEGALGILANQGGSLYYKPNLGKGNFGSPVMLPKVPSLYGGKAQPPQLIDLAGDGHIDMVSFAGVAQGLYKRNVENEPDGWEPWKAFKTLPNIPWSDPNLRFVDLTGDGHADVLITEDNIFTIYPSLLEDGFGPPKYWRPPMDENHGPQRLSVNNMESIFFADMTGDGLSDLVRIRYNQVCYWPNQGYGRFGQKISMSNSPLLHSQGLFKQSCVHLADIDGSGTTDILYVDGNATKYYLNQAGNGWTYGFCISSFPGTNDTTNVQVVDLLAKGTACLVWSSTLASDFGTQVRYVDLMATGKPYLVVKSTNNLGSETRYSYSSSSQLYLADKEVGQVWVTKVPFPVQVVTKIETFDYISKSRFVSQYAYHHGYYDGFEKEFHGFGMVETWDTETSALISKPSVMSLGREYSNWDLASFSPPVHTKTWFHTGAQLACASAETSFKAYYWADESIEIQDSVLPSLIRVRAEEFVEYDLNPMEVRESYRALKGSILRVEIYALDGTEQARRPYTVDQNNFVVDMLQPQSTNQHAIFHLRPFETVKSAHDRQLYLFDDCWVSDPRVTHAISLKTDMFGNVLQTVSLSYGRRYPDSSDLLSDGDRRSQERSYYLLTENKTTNVVDSKDDWLTPLAAETSTYELYNVQNSNLRYGIVSSKQLRAVLEILTAGNHDLAYECFGGPPNENHHPHRRLLQHSRNIYRRDDLTGPLEVGEVESKAFPYFSLQLVITPRQVDEVFVQSGKLKADDVSHTLGQVCGYMKEDDGNWWARSAKSYFSPNREDTYAQELGFGQRHFFHPCRMESQFSTPIKPIESIVTFDRYDLLAQETCDALGNRMTAGERDMNPTMPLIRNGQDYRIMTPWLTMDANRNMTTVVTDVMGLVVGTAVLGKPEAAEGDSLDNFEANLSEQAVRQFFDAPLKRLHTLLGSATSRVIYDHWAYFNTKNDVSPQPVWSSTLFREIHVSQLKQGETSRITVDLSYSDGLMRNIQSKIQAEPSLVRQKLESTNGTYLRNKREVIPACQRWVGSGWVVYNNKGKPVRKFEPFFTESHQFESNTRVGVSSISLYDPLERVVAMIKPDHTWTKVTTNPWRIETWDSNDLVLISDPRSDPDLGSYFKLLPEEDYLPTWYDQRKCGQMGREAQIAAKKAATHADSPRITCLDALGRTFVGFEIVKTLRNDSEQPAVQFQRNNVILDIQGNQHALYDSLGRLATQARYNYLGALLHQSGMENGQRWVLNDILGNGVLLWDSRNQRHRIEHDELRRPISSYLTLAGEVEIQIEHSLFGDTLDNAETFNGRTKIIEIKDQSGITTTPFYNFKGNLLRTSFQPAMEYRKNINWADEVLLVGTQYQQTMEYDAKSRITKTVLPDGTIKLCKYNARGLEESVISRLRGQEVDRPSSLGSVYDEKSRLSITGIDYDAKGQRTRIEYGNGSHTQYAYDALAFRLVKLQTSRGSDTPLQNLSYTYDAVGNVSHIRDDAQQTVFFRNQRVDPNNEYTYDSTYRLIMATGREHLGQIKGKANHLPTAPAASDDCRSRLELPGDGKAMARYSELYFYDQVGNIKVLKHQGSDATHPGWTRRYVYNETSQLEATKVSNRLSSTTIGRTTETYRYDGTVGLHGNMTAMPHLSMMQWDHKDQLKATSMQLAKNGSTPEKTWYVYNAAGQRVRKVTERVEMAGQGGPTLLKERIYLGDFEIYRKYQSNGVDVDLERETLHATDSSKKRIALVETRTKGTESNGVPRQLIRFQLGNHLGSASLELDDHAQTVSYEEYYPYGSTSFQGVRSQTETSKRYRFTGKERDEENGLYYHGARYYASWLGRWTSCDPSGMVDGSNLYVYARDNPSNLTDPNGRETGPKWQEVVVNGDDNGKYYSLEGTDVYRHDTKNYSEAWHEDGGDSAIEFAPDKISVPSVDKIAADAKKLDRPDFYLKYKDQFTPQQMQEVIQYVPIRPIPIPAEDTTIYMDEGGHLGTAESLARDEMAAQLANIQAPSEIGAVYGMAALALGGDTQEAVRMMHVGNQVSKLVSPIIAVTAMAAMKGGGGKEEEPETPVAPPPSKGPKLSIVDNDGFVPTKTPEEAIQGATMKVYDKLMANRPLISDNLSPGQRMFAGFGDWAQKIVFGNAVEKALAVGAAPTGLLTHTGNIRPYVLGGPDFTGNFGTPYQDLNFQITSEKQFLRGNHVRNSPEGTLFGLHKGYVVEE